MQIFLVSLASSWVPQVPSRWTVVASVVHSPLILDDMSKKTNPRCQSECMRRVDNIFKFRNQQHFDFDEKRLLYRHGHRKLLWGLDFDFSLPQNLDVSIVNALFRMQNGGIQTAFSTHFYISAVVLCLCPALKTAGNSLYFLLLSLGGNLEKNEMFNQSLIELSTGVFVRI